MYDLPPPSLDDYLAFIPEQPLLMEKARNGSDEAREKLCSLIYVMTFLQKGEGVSWDQIRERHLLRSDDVVGAATLGQERRFVDVASAIEDALAGRPPRYPKWINLAALEDFRPAHSAPNR